LHAIDHFLVQISGLIKSEKPHFTALPFFDLRGSGSLAFAAVGREGVIPQWLGSSGGIWHWPPPFHAIDLR